MCNICMCKPYGYDEYNIYFIYVEIIAYIYIYNYFFKIIINCYLPYIFFVRRIRQD